MNIPSEKVDSLKKAIAEFLANPPELESPPERQTVRISTYVTPSEWKVLQERMRGLKPAMWVRKVLLDAVPRPRPLIPQMNRQTFIELTRIRESLNQQTQFLEELLQTGRFPPLSSRYLEELHQLRQLLEQIRDQIAPPPAAIEGEERL